MCLRSALKRTYKRGITNSSVKGMVQLGDGRITDLLTKRPITFKGNDCQVRKQFIIVK